VVSFNGKRIGFIVDKLLQQKEIVEKPLRKPFDSISYLSGVTILGNGNVCLALSIPGILNALVGNQLNRTINA
jgi:two-component system chemotaxis sensor kinase CheA